MERPQLTKSLPLTLLLLALLVGCGSTTIDYSNYDFVCSQPTFNFNYNPNIARILWAVAVLKNKGNEEVGDVFSVSRGGRAAGFTIAARDQVENGSRLQYTLTGSPEKGYRFQAINPWTGEALLITTILDATGLSGHGTCSVSLLQTSGTPTIPIP